MSTTTLPAISINRTYAAVLDDGRVLATHSPGGSWAIHLVEVDSGWSAIAFPRGHDSEPFTVASGSDKDLVQRAAYQWVSTATVGIPLSRFIFRGTTNRTPGTINNTNAQGGPHA